VIDNRPGANTIIGAQAAAKAAADGYTLFMAIDSTLVMKQLPGWNLEEHLSTFLRQKPRSSLPSPPSRVTSRNTA